MIVYSDFSTMSAARESLNSWAFSVSRTTPLQERTQSEVLKHAETVGLGVTTQRPDENGQKLLDEQLVATSNVLLYLLV